MKTSLIIFAGAGASYGVSREKYPMAVGFREKLPPTVTGDFLYQRLFTYLANAQGGSVDIEHVLWALDRFLEALHEFTLGNRFGASLLSGNLINSVPGTASGPEGNRIQPLFSHVEAVAKTLQGAINTNIYDFYAKPPDEGELDRSWAPLLQWAAGAGFARVDLVTTNYDMVLEHALERVEQLGTTFRVNTGWKRKLSETTLDLRRWESDGAAEGGLLTKLHGSVDWYRGGTEATPVIRLGHFEFDGDHQKRSIIYPGFKGRPSDVPFLTLHEYFRRRVNEASHMLFIGFAFRDDYINDLLRTTTQPTANVAIVNPTRPVTKPFAQEPVYIEQYFGSAPPDVTVPPSPNLVNEVSDWAEGIRTARIV